jgi:hypothetical protein
MSRRLRKTARAAVATALATACGLSVAAATASTAEARDAYPCVRLKEATFTWSGDSWRETEMRCAITQGNVPVYGSVSTKSWRAGTLARGGTANWFLFESRGAEVRLGRGANNWWASTQADNGNWGWVNEVYFRGGANYEDDAGLLKPGPVSCWNVCPTRPPWQFPPDLKGAS